MKYFIVFFIITLLFLNNLQAWNKELKLDVLKVMQLAHKNNNDIEIARVKLLHAVKKAEAAYRKFSFKLDLGVTAITEDMPSYFLAKTADSRSLNMMAVDLNNPGTNKHYETALELSYPLYFRGLKRITRSFADLDKNIAAREFDAYSNKIVSAAITLYYHYRIALESVVTEKDSLKRVKAQLKDIKIKYKGGSALKTDYLGMQVRVKETHMRLIKSENNLKIAKSILLNFIGHNDSTEIKIVDKDWDLKKLPVTFEKALNEANQNRAEIEAAKLMIKKAGLGIKMAASVKKPEVLLFGKLAYNDDSLTLDSDKDSNMMGLKINFNLWDNRLSKAEKIAANIQKKQVKIYLKKLYSEIELDVRKSFENLKSQKEVLKVAEANLEFAKENMILMKKRYLGGLITITDFLDTEQAYSSALLNFIASKYQLLMTKAELARAMGYCFLCVNKKM